MCEMKENEENVIPKKDYACLLLECISCIFQHQIPEYIAMEP